MASFSDDDITDLKVAVARIEERQDALPLVIREAIREALQPSQQRIDALEKDVGKARAYGAALVAIAGAAGWVAEHWKSILPLVLVFVAGCSSAPDGRSWPEELRPVAVLVPRDIPEDCQASALNAVEWWSQYVSYLEPVRVAETTDARLGEIAFQYGQLEGPEIGRAEWQLVDGEMAKVRITLEWCDEQTAAHELAHAIGLDHVQTPGNLMYPSAQGAGWELEGWQIEAVR